MGIEQVLILALRGILWRVLCWIEVAKWLIHKLQFLV